MPGQLAGPVRGITALVLRGEFEPNVGCRYYFIYIHEKRQRERADYQYFMPDATLCSKNLMINKTDKWPGIIELIL